jgi:hypothetical protein
MLSIKVNDNDDIFFIDGELAWAEDKDACSQDVVQSIKTRINACILDATAGIDYNNNVFSNINYTTFKNQLTVQVKKVPNVIDVLDLEVAKKDNTLAYLVIFSTIYGEFDLTGTLNTGQDKVESFTNSDYSVTVAVSGY